MIKTVINGPLPAPDLSKTKVELLTQRTSLAKRRWLGVASNGTEFGFDVHNPLLDGSAFYENETEYYVIVQKPEPVLEIALGEDASTAAKLGWSLGNLHFPVEIDGPVLRVVDDSAVRAYLERDYIPYLARDHVFKPLKAGAHSHGHAH
jgi:urease accessory protein